MKAAIIGLGSIAPVHYQAVERAGGAVVALCDIDPEKRENFARLTGSRAPLYADYREMLAKETPDVVHICTPHYLHAPMVIDALRAGFHVLCEKPLCIREEDIAPIRAAAADSGRQVAVCLQNRYNQSNLAARDLLGGRAAAAGFASVVWARSADYYHSGVWRGRWDTEGGGVMINQALHTLDLMLWFMGMPESVIATTENRHLSGVIEVEDTASALFRYADGRVFSFFATTASGADFPVQVMLRAADGTRIVAANDTLTVNGEIRPSPAGTLRYGKDVWGDGHAALVADYYRHLEEGRPFPIGTEAGAGVLRAILAMYRSHGREVRLAADTKEETPCT